MPQSPPRPAPAAGLPGGRFLGPYRRLFTLPGATAFTVTGLVARVPFGMFSVSAVLMVTAAYDSYALAGAVTATQMVTSAIVVPLTARLADRHGQARILVPTATLAATGHLALVVCVLADAPVWTLFAVCLLTCCSPNTGGMVRARWAHLFRDDPAARHTANSFEQALDELCFVSGPVLAAVLCTSLFPAAGTLTGAGLLLFGTLAFAAQRRTEPPVERRRATGGPSPLRVPGMVPLLATFACTGAIFGSLEVVTIAFAEEQGLKGWAGPVLAMQALGSALAGLMFGLLRLGGSVRGRFTACVALMAVLMAMPLLAAQAHNLPLLAPVLLLAGMATAPTMVTGMTLAQSLSPAGRLNESMTLAVTALLTGLAAGAAGGGWAVDHLPGDVAFSYVFPAAAALLAALVATATLPRGRGGPGGGSGSPAGGNRQPGRAQPQTSGAR
ncbi:MFS transporter [Streptomyces sp. YIM 98790]|uniref:MFS transporter n=1 Tax=Streptomyces sp. YIM 98790 TaxID=2689077 RepID=UPI001FB6BD7F|nr:MFS transporter [Streptomyces sp. YIM 98790]